MRHIPVIKASRQRKDRTYKVCLASGEPIIVYATSRVAALARVKQLLPNQSFTNMRYVTVERID